MKCAAEWREDDGELARCELEEGHAGVHRWRNVLPAPVVEPIRPCPTCRELACVHKTIAAIEFGADRAAGLVRFRLDVFVGALPAVEAARLGEQLLRAAKEALR